MDSKIKPSKFFNKERIVFIPCFAIGLLLLFNLTSIVNYSNAQDENVTISTTKLTNNTYMIKGSGGNIIVSVGQDGVFMVDDQFAPLTEKIKEAILNITDQPVKFVINTHWHSDHTGGNENFGELSAVIISHDNVRERLSTEQFSAFFN